MLCVTALQHQKWRPTGLLLLYAISGGDARGMKYNNNNNHNFYNNIHHKSNPRYHLCDVGAAILLYNDSLNHRLFCAVGVLAVRQPVALSYRLLVADSVYYS